MSTQFNILFTVAPAHAYYIDTCEDIRFILPRDAAQVLRNGKLLAKTRDGKLYVLFEASDGGAALAPIPGKTIRIGLQLANAYFSNFTEVAADFASTQLLYRNAAVPTALDAPANTRLVGQLFSHTLTDTPRPVIVTLKNAAGDTVQAETVTVADNRTGISCDLSGKPPGAYTIEETYPASTTEIACYSDAELASAGVFAVLEVTIDPGFYTAPANFQIAFNARQETLKYYVVATNYPNGDFNQLSVVDAGFAEDGRPQINFTKVPSASFTPAEISPALLGNGSAKIVLFRSQAVVARTQKPRKKIQLKKNNEVLVAHLPQPGPEKHNADLIIPVSKT
jgi:hypothetical protein